MAEPNWGKIKDVIDFIVTFGLPLMKAGAERTQNPYDNIVVAFVEGGLPKVSEVLGELEEGE